MYSIFNGFRSINLKSMKSLIVTLIFFTTLIINGRKTEPETITINPYLSFQHYEHFKRLILSSPDLDIEYIKGFEFQWGYTYKLKVRKSTLESVLSDGTQYDFSLEKIISKKKVTENYEFQLYLDANRYYHQVDATEKEINKTLKRINDTTYIYFDTIEIEVPKSLHEEFQSIVDSKTAKMGTFMFINEKRVRLIKL